MAYRDNDQSSPASAENALVAGANPSGDVATRQDSFPLATANGYGANGFGTPEVLRRSMDAQSMLNALRRRWILALGIGAIVGGASALAMWFLFPESSSAQASFRVVSEEQTIFGQKTAMSPQAYEVEKRTQIATIKGEWLLQAALRDPAVNSLSALAGERDKVQWLQDNIVVDFPQQGEILTITLTGDDPPSDQKQLVDAVATAYFDDVKFRDSLRKRMPVDELEKSLTALLKDRKQKMDTYLALAKEMGSSAANENNAEVGLIVSRLTTLNNKKAELEGKILQSQSDFMMFTEQLKDPSRLKAEVEDALAVDPTLSYLNSQLMGYQVQAMATNPRHANKQSKMMEERINQLRQQIANYRAGVEQQMAQERANTPDDSKKLATKLYGIQLTTLQRQFEGINNAIETEQLALDKMLEKSVELETMAAELDQQQRLADEMQDG
jgi:hypothetical protein